jgi:hypothetical protein
MWPDTMDYEHGIEDVQIFGVASIWRGTFDLKALATRLPCLGSRQYCIVNGSNFTTVNFGDFYRAATRSCCCEGALSILRIKFWK